MIDPIQAILGELQNAQTHFQIQRPEIKLQNPTSGEIVGTTRTDVPDLFFVAGSLPQSDFVEKGASLSVRYRGGAAFKGEPAFVWTVTGEKGELRLVSPAGPALQILDVKAQITIEVHDFETDEVAPVEWEWTAYQQDIPVAGRSIAALYEAYAAGDESKYATFEDALHRHEQLEKWLGGFRV